MKLNQLYHLYSRIGFGIQIDDAKAKVNTSLEQLIDEQLALPTDNVQLKLVTREDLPSKDQLKLLSPQEKIALRKKLRGHLKDLNTTWMKQLIQTDHLLLEKTTLFWHGHFACFSENPYFAQQLNNIQRTYALGPFKKLLLAVSKSPAMLQFLNNRQNKKTHPNENFARELMELFTIGKGNYTEQDIKESARAFTGWSFDANTYEFTFNPKSHDYGTKTFMGHTGSFEGDDIIDLLLRRKETARFICKKIYIFFINEKVDDLRLAELTDFYYSNDYHTGKLLKKIATSDWFYEEQNRGANIKSPVDFIVGFSRTFNIIPSDALLLKLQRSLDQLLFFPPNVAGWPGGKDWIDSTTLMFRLKLPSTILNGGKITFIEKDNMPEDSFNLPDTIEVSRDTGLSMLHCSPEEIMEALLRMEPNANNKRVLLETAEKRQLVLDLVSMPEYQLY